MRSFGHDEVIIAYIGFIILTYIMFLSLQNEVAYESQYLEMNVPSDENFTYSMSIRNIGSDLAMVTCSEVGFKQIKLRLPTDSKKIKPNADVPINITVDAKDTPPGVYKGYIYIKDDNSNVLEKIPIIIQVKNSSRNSNSSF